MRAIILLLCISAMVWGSIGTRVEPGELTYLGAFRLPDGVSDIKSWAWGGYAMAFYPNGDPGGANDGFPGSLFGTGHAWQHQVSELSIPAPVISASKNVTHLNTAGILQSFYDIIDVGSLEMPRVGLSYLPAQGSQGNGKLYYCRGEHLEDDLGYLTHGWFNVTLSTPQTAGNWYLNTAHNIYNTNDYMFPIPLSWGSIHTPGKLLATGRFRDGGWSGEGPSLYAIGPWNEGNPPANGTSLQYVKLLQYTSSEDFGEPVRRMTNYHHSDEWSGAVWLTAGNKSAVVFVGTKGTGDCWYGDSNGPCLDCAGERGWWSTGFVGQLIFYDPDDLAQVAAGNMQPWEPQPYATLNIDNYLYHITSSQQWYHLGGSAFDSENGYLYVFEPFADGDKPIVHVWQVIGSGSGGGGNAEITTNRSRLNFGALDSGSTSEAQTFVISNTGTEAMNWSISDDKSWLSCSPVSGSQSGVVTVSVNTTGLSVGQYSGQISIGSGTASNSPMTVTVYLQVYASGGTSHPFGHFATPLDNAAVNSSIAVTGWALDDMGVESVKIYRQQGSRDIYIGDAVFVAGSRPDVESYYSSYPMNYKAGWGYMLLTNFLPNNGNGTFVLRAVARDLEGHTTTLGSKTITCNNLNAVKPFGAIDTPGQGEVISGSSYYNWGWVLTPQPNEIAVDGSTINVWIDGKDMGHPSYNLYRADIAGLFPGYANSLGAVGYIIIDTTKLPNGVHTIQWTATDNANNSDGIGSRYFTVQNNDADNN
jgi:Viral BACON domain